MSLEIVAGLLGSQLVRAVACEIATTLLCQGIQQAVTSVAQPRTNGRAAEIEATVRALHGVTSAKANALTGTLLVHFNQVETSLGGIVAALEPPLPARRPRATERAPHLRLVVG